MLMVPKKIKITVYAIAKNESKFVDRWVDSMSEADEIVVLDTGSTDDTVERLRSRGVKVETRIISPWRFDVARNESMKLIPPDTDICLCTDLDEIFVKGWRRSLENAVLSASNDATTFTYEYVWNFQEDGKDGAKFEYEKCHRPGVCRWAHPVHEVLEYSVPKVRVHVPGMRLEHHADPYKSRAQYLDLLKMSVQESPDDDRNMHYYGRELMFHGKWCEAIEILKRHLAMPSATWRAERASSMRYIARCYVKINQHTLAELWLWRACFEAPEQREAPLELAELLYDRKDYVALVRACEICLSRKDRVMTYLTMAEAWGYRPWDLYSLGLWYTGRKAEALEAVREAVRLAPDDSRLNANMKLMVDAVGVCRG